MVTTEPITKPATLQGRIRAAWKRRQRRLINQAIATYCPKKHFLSCTFRPIVGAATLRSVRGQSDRNKPPLHTHNLGPWVAVETDE